MKFFPECEISHQRLRVGLWALAVSTLHHLSLWATVAKSRNISITSLLSKWDSFHYQHIIQHGYDGANAAFLPLYPGLVKVLSGLVPNPILLGIILGPLLCALSVWWVESSEFLRPRHSWSWWIFFYSVGSLSLLTLHTESLFLILSIGAIHFALRQKLFETALCCALAVMTRNQGAVLALSVGIFLFFSATDRKSAWKRLLGVGLFSLAGLMAVMLFHAVNSGNAFAHFEAQKSWSHIQTFDDVVGTLFRGENAGRPWEQLSIYEQSHFVFAWVWLFFSCWMLFSKSNSPERQRLQRCLGLYGVFSFSLMVLQTTFDNAFRFSSILFFFWFSLGDFLLPSQTERPRKFMAYVPFFVTLACLVVLSHWTALRFVKSIWAY